MGDTIEDLEARIVARMTPSERGVHEQGCQIVDFYFDIACDERMPYHVVAHARDKLRSFANRKPEQTVADVDGSAEQ